MSMLKTFTATVFTLLLIAENANAQNAYTVVQMIQTPLSREDMAKALKQGHVRAFGSEPNESRLAMGWAQVALENGHGRYVYNHNLGNTTAWATGQSAYYNPGDHNYYKSYATFSDGAAAYWETIKRCTAAVVDFDKGDSQKASHDLKACHYYEALEAPYARLLKDLFDYAKRSVLPGVYNDERLKQQIQQLVGNSTTSPT